MKPFAPILFALSMLVSSHVVARGLKFAGNECPIAERTSYDVLGGERVAFSGRFEIGFRLSLSSDAQVGYILRIKERQNSDIYNLFYDGQGSNHVFRLNREGCNCIIRLDIPRAELPDGQWFAANLRFDPAADSIRLTVAGRSKATVATELPVLRYPMINFGMSDHIIDVPSFAISDLVVSSDNLRYVFPLQEAEGNTVHDDRGRALGAVSNPEWLINRAYRWRFLASFRSESVAGANYDHEAKAFYYFNSDSITRYDVPSGRATKRRTTNACPVPLKLGTNFIDPAAGRLNVYEVYPELRDRQASVASLDPNTLTWRTESLAALPMQLHHHGCCFDSAARRYIIFGGFGNMRYNGAMYALDMERIADGWQTVELTGDAICPRYFQSVGYRKQTGHIYIFGGMGNESGEQAVGRRYLYDLYRVDPATGDVARLWDIEWPEGNVAPVREMVIPDDESFYTLCYPEHFSDSFLRLYRFSLADGSYAILGDSIPIRSDKITTNANLYYDRQLNSLFAVVQEFDDDDVASSLKIYSLDFPPISAEELTLHAGKRGFLRTLAVIVSICTIATGALLFGRRRRAARAASGSAAGSEAGAPRPNSILLFGGFSARDKHGKDISHLFSNRLRQAFCLVLHYSDREGLASQRMGEMLWPDKRKEEVKNSIGVTVNHLRKALGEFDGIELINDRGRFRIMQRGPFYCDHTRVMQIVASSEKQKENRTELLDILRRGKFLQSADHRLFDQFKEETERRLEPILLRQMKECFAEREYRAAIDFAEAMFWIDPLNDVALNILTRSLRKLEMHKEANIRQQAFAAEYLKTMGQNLPTE
ncbi:MAG: DNA-binding transcriptional activator [Rikenellaceae bacterium]|jgi:DNA-binding SARP family transcriptional activator|nr:DNA-binding transcriptional activator [Rikenellaceae bacterium]